MPVGKRDGEDSEHMPLGRNVSVYTPVSIHTIRFHPLYALERSLLAGGVSN